MNGKNSRTQDFEPSLSDLHHLHHLHHLIISITNFLCYSRPMQTVPQWISEVLRFWFEETPPRAWFVRDEALDAEIRKRFGALHASLNEKVPASVTTTPLGALATVIVLDQFSRNLYRISPRAFSADPTSLA